MRWKRHSPPPSCFISVQISIIFCQNGHGTTSMPSPFRISCLRCRQSLCTWISRQEQGFCDSRIMEPPAPSQDSALKYLESGVPSGLWKAKNREPPESQEDSCPAAHFPSTPILNATPWVTLYIEAECGKREVFFLRGGKGILSGRWVIVGQ